MHKIIITGGHHNSALVVAQELIRRGHKVIWIGHRHSSRGDTKDSAEYLEVTTSRIPFYDLVAGRLIPSLTEMLRFPVGVYVACKIIQKEKPIAILSFGGYLGGTVALAGKFCGVKIYLHEQTVTAGRANKFIGHLAKKVYLTWKESAKYFSISKTTVLGLPLREGILNSPKKSLFSRQKPAILVMGGKQGAHAINQFIFDNLRDILPHFNLVHQTGTSSVTQDYEKSLALQESLGSLGDSYLPLGYITQNEIGSYLHNVDFYFGRSGAHICYELGVIGLKSILVPLMSTHDHEQLKNAQILVNAKQGVVLPQSSLKLETFLTTLAKLKNASPVALNLNVDATKLLIDHLLKELKKNG